MADINGEVAIRHESDIILVRKTVREECEKLNFSLTNITRIVTAASELARNIYLYAGLGLMRWRILERNAAKGIELTFEDHGPGITNLKQVMQEGFSTSQGLGLGLPGAQRLMDEMKIESRVGEGTIVIITKWQR
ncbi:MAG: anti-sigma regulatory factor [Syntrophomonadaceae bacterium]|jgi:serine/threonine-protein kinase RsbT